MHDAQHVLKSRVLRGRKYPPGRLKLMYLAQSLQPRMVDDLALRDLAGRQGFVGHQRTVAVQRIVTQGLATEVRHWAGSGVASGTRRDSTFLALNLNRDGWFRFGTACDASSAMPARPHATTCISEGHSSTVTVAN